MTYTHFVDVDLVALYKFMAAMAMHPEVLKKAHEENSLVIGPDWLPDMSDIDSCILAGFPYQMRTKPPRMMNARSTVVVGNS